jgi:hypothetical protein
MRSCGKFRVAHAAYHLEFLRREAEGGGAKGRTSVARAARLTTAPRGALACELRYD